MIPIEILNNKGELIGQQAFNDNLTTVEQINRVMVQTLFYLHFYSPYHNLY